MICRQAEQLMSKHKGVHSVVRAAKDTLTVESWDCSFYNLAREELFFLQFTSMSIKLELLLVTHDKTNAGNLSKQDINKFTV